MTFRSDAAVGRGIAGFGRPSYIRARTTRLLV